MRGLVPEKWVYLVCYSLSIYIQYMLIVNMENLYWQMGENLNKTVFINCLANKYMLLYTYVGTIKRII